MSGSLDQLQSSIVRHVSQRERAEPVSWRVMTRVQRNVRRSILRLGCKVFEGEIPTRAFFHDYFEEQPAMLLLDGQDSGLEPGTHGFTSKRVVEIGGKKRSLFVVVAAPSLNDFEWLFTVAHEVGHILLHGRIIDSGMLVARRYNEWFTQGFDFQRRMLEVEANIYAFYSLIPTELVDLVSKIAGRQPCVDDLRHATSFLYGEDVDEEFIRERLTLHVIHRTDEVDPALKIRGRRWLKELQRSDSSWLWRGAGSDRVTPVRRVLGRDQRGQLLAEARSRGILGKELHERAFSRLLQEQGGV